MKKIHNSLFTILFAALGLSSLFAKADFHSLKEVKASSSVNAITDVHVRGTSASDMYLLVKFSATDYPSSMSTKSLSNVVSSTGANFLDKTIVYFSNSTNKVLKDVVSGDNIEFSKWAEQNCFYVKLDISSFADYNAVPNIVFLEDCTFPCYSSNNNYSIGSLTVAKCSGNVANYLYTYTVKSASSQLPDGVISNFYTENVDNSKNELITFKFKNNTDFNGIGKKKIDASKHSYFSNFADHVTLYDKNNQELPNSFSEVYYNYTEDNSISFLINGSGDATKVNIKQGLYFPSYSCLEDDYLSSTYGKYCLVSNYKLVLSSTAIHTSGSKNEWGIPLCHIYYYDENDNIITNLSTTAGCNTVYSLENVISKKGYSSKWVVSEPATVQIVNNTISIPDDECDIKIKLTIEARTYTLSFEGLAFEKQVTYDQIIGELPEVPEVEGKAGYWAIDGETIVEDSYWLFDENKTAAPMYFDLYLSVIYDTYGGTSVDEDDVLYGTCLESLPETSKEGYTFGGWYYEDTFENEFQLTDTITTDIVLYAKWISKHIVSFDSDGGSFIDSVEVDDGEVLTSALTPTKLGYEFIGWTLNGQPYDFTCKVTSDITLIASWNKIATGDEEENKGGCNGSISAIGGISLLALAFVISKKKFFN